MEEKNIFEILAESIRAGRPVALVTVIAVGGSTPREAGARMLVFGDGLISGTVGGGKLEAEAMKSALAALEKGESGKIKLSLTPSGIGMRCSGEAELFIEAFVQPLKLLILGAGHVGQKIAACAALAGIPYSVADDRPEFANRELFPAASEIILKKPHAAITKKTVDEKTRVVIVTRGHALDGECLEAALKTKAPYIGMIGSRNKVMEAFRDFNRKGLHPEKDPRVFSPIGLDLGGKTPGAIAVSVMAEILKHHNRRSGGHMKIRPDECRP